MLLYHVFGMVLWGLLPMVLLIYFNDIFFINAIF